MPEAETIATLSRTLDGKVEAPPRYVMYEGQVIVRTRAATSQRWVKEGWDTRRRGVYPYILGSSACTENPADEDAMNPELGPNEISVFYVEDGDTVRYEVAD